MPSGRYPEDQYLTPDAELFEHAALAVMRDAKAGLNGLPGWLKGRVLKTPVRIFDINGTLLFLDYEVAKGRDTFGYVRTAASQIVGSPVIAIELGRRSWDFDAAVKRLTPRVKKAYPGATVSKPSEVRRVAKMNCAIRRSRPTRNSRR